MSKEGGRNGYIDRDDHSHATLSRHHRSEPKPVYTLELDPSKLNLDKTTDFLKFLTALAANQKRSKDFLQKIPPERIQELKEKYKFLGALVVALG